MARLTEAEKEVRKAARKLRDAAWRDRVKARLEIEKRVSAEIEAEFGPPLDAAIKVREDLVRTQIEELKTFDDRIAALRKEMDVRRQALAPDIQAAAAEASRIATLKRKAGQALDQRLNLDFPDLAWEGRWSASAWEEKRKKLEMA